MAKQEIQGKGFPAPRSLFSRGIVISNPQKVIFLSGVGSYKGGGIKEQTREVYQTITALLKEAGASWSNVVRVLFFMRDVDRDFEEFDKVRREFFKHEGIQPPYPASTGVQARMIPPGLLLEMEVTAVID